MLINPKLYEINTRVWIKRFAKGTTLSNIPQNYWEDLAAKGIDIVWLLGVWKTCTNLIATCCFSEDLTNSYNKSLRDWSRDDVIGSPFSIDDYEVNPLLGTWDDLNKLHKILNSLGIKLMLDFIPNHFGADSSLIKTNPEIFLKADKVLYENDPFTFFMFNDDETQIFAHGRDPLFPAWTDTIQINYFSQEARIFMTNRLLKIAGVCDGVRCDMAMLSLNNIFRNTWLGVLDKGKFMIPQNEFWEYAIQKVKNKFPDFIFLAEAYWDREWDLQQLGFDFTYDKRLTDRLASNDIPGVKAHLHADKDFQMKSARFLENHDEPRAVMKFGKNQSIAASVLISTINGMKLFFDGQFEGKKTKLPLQLGREPDEKISKTISEHYNKLLLITKAEIFKYGTWVMLEPDKAAENNFSSEFMFAWQWKFKNQNRVIIINFSDSTSQCRLKFDLNINANEIILKDLLTGERYYRNVSEIRTIGLFVELKSFHSHIFSFTL
jgi:hypothetical protein